VRELSIAVVFLFCFVLFCLFWFVFVWFFFAQITCFHLPNLLADLLVVCSFHSASAMQESVVLTKRTRLYERAGRRGIMRFCPCVPDEHDSSLRNTGEDPEMTQRLTMPKEAGGAAAAKQAQPASSKLLCLCLI
jgi:hypothetical protein